MTIHDAQSVDDAARSGEADGLSVAPQPKLVGALDDVEQDGRVAGWARLIGSDTTVDVEILIDDILVGHVFADQHRADLTQNGWQDCAFWYDLPREFRDGHDHLVEARFAATGEQLRNSPRNFLHGSNGIENAPRSAARARPASGNAVSIGQPASPANTATPIGSFDGIEEGGWAAGWARRRDGAEKIGVEAWVDGQLIGAVPADQFRADLHKDGVADCAFWFGIPEDLLDGDEHWIDLRYAGTDISLPGSPRTFAIRTFATGPVADDLNLIRSADFGFWPTGLRVAPRERFEEVVTGWYYDFSHGTRPTITFEADKPRDVGLLRHAYAMRITVEEGGADGYMRLIVPIAITPADLGRYRFSAGFRRPPSAADDALYVAEIFVGTFDNMMLDRVTTLRRVMKPRGTMRIANLPAVSDPQHLAGVGPDATLALVLELRGNGELTIFSPALLPGSGAPPLDEDGELGEFEDPRIRDQIADLKLSPIWARHRAIATAAIGETPIAAVSRIERRAMAAVPFIQVVMPVYNAATDAEDLLRSILRCTDTPMEILIFDDGSSAFTEERIGAWETIDPRIRYFRHRANVGYTRNINFGSSRPFRTMRC